MPAAEKNRTAEPEKLDREEIVKKKWLYWIGRRTQDLFFASLALIVLGPFMLVVAALIYLDDPQGSPIFFQTRIGRKGVPFKFYKFRSMYVDAESRLEELLEENEMDGPVFKIKDDPRITRIGRFIRRTSIDELPQLWNIIKGDMSIVGPRPALPREVEQYTEHQLQRLYVTPGLTCIWQVHPKRNDLSFDEWMELDIKYMKERNFWMDWKLIFQTFGAVLGMQGR